MTETRLRSGQVAAAAGVNIETLRYYERRGLLPQPPRSLGGHRLYPPETVTSMRAIKAAQKLGFKLAEVRDLLASARLRDGSDSGLQSRAAAKLAEVDRKLAELTSLRATLGAAVAAGCDDLIACAESPCCPLPFDDEMRE
ncbi:MerR family transcriptional regulator [Mycolicibacterium agri]|uniref:MerR family transcriptional regulator n=1 Tax=Mycolicibacterium agri TaxID=36811 RepID=A0A2A7N6U1_MYCAG|nr:MerR family transcriptional regulator [Mycolicibacterium agri]PEG39570.1 MerR family transcriptional regulator [Mycolicibacterium agri]GFG48589.1 hypothetical protein MAGR_00300 [Mycolicibacterium agri]